MKRIFLFAAMALASLSLNAKVELTPLFSDNIVFQQKCQAPVWGKAAPGANVSVIPSWNKRTYSTTASADGKWCVKIDTPKGSFKKHSVTISDGEPVVLHNVLVGEVWLASGQSNMQMPVESWRAVRTNQEDIANASKWADLRPKLAHVKSLSDNESERERTFEEEIDAFYKKVTKQDQGLKDGKAIWAEPGFDDSAWRTIPLPCKVQELWPAVNGIFWFRKQIDIPDSWEGKDLTLCLGPIDDFDETYWNAEFVGSGRIWNKTREYTVPGRLVKAGKTVICIRNTDDHGDGGLYGDPALLYVEGPDGKKIRLDNEWKVTLSVSFEGVPKSTAREPNLVTVLYNAMIKPLAPFAIKGAIWYQGESNAEKAYRYRDLMSAMILDWRALWGYDFPFYITQIANYKGVRKVAGDDDWAELREAQALATKTVDKCGMACIIDLGEAEDIHPVRKKEVGERLANLAEVNDYGRKGIANGPRFESYKIENACIKVHFTDVAGGLRVIPSGKHAEDRYGKTNVFPDMVAKAERGELTGFQICGADRVWHWADAAIVGNEVVVSCPEVAHPIAVRYAWGANPVCNLYNSEGLPAWPFRTDDWPGVTYGKL